MFDFFSNFGNYMPHMHCMRNADGTVDYPWVIAFLGLTVGVIAAYLKIYVFWMRAYFREKKEDRNRKLVDLGNLFLWCATTSYVLTIVTFFFPIYRAQVLFLVGLNILNIRFLRGLSTFGEAFTARRLGRENEVLEAAVAERTKFLSEKTDALEAANEQMNRVLSSVDQGLLTIGSDGQIRSDVSRAAIEWLGPVPESKGFTDWLATHDETLAVMLDTSLEMIRDGFPAEVAVDQMPTRMVLGGRTLGIDYQPIQDESSPDECSELLIVLTDLTSAIERQRLEREQGEVVAVFQKAVADRLGFVEFWAEAGSLVEDLAGGKDDDLALVKRKLHTLKGNTAVFGVQSFAELCHDLEEKLVDRQGPLKDSERDQLRAAWDKLRSKLTMILDDRRGDVLEIGEAEYSMVLDAVAGGLSGPRLEKMLRAWRLQPAASALGRLRDQVNGLAQRLGKSVTVRVDANGVRMGSERWRAFWSSMVHVVRNAVDHGAETTDERSAAGKDPSTSIELSTELANDQLVVEIRDDGRGIDWSAVADKARSKGLAADNQSDLTDAIFADGLSTRDTVSALSGRGVGLAAVRQETTSLGGRIELDSTVGEGTKLRFLFPANEALEVARLTAADLGPRDQRKSA